MPLPPPPKRPHKPSSTHSKPTGKSLFPSDLPTSLLKQLARLGYRDPTPIQRHTLPIVRSGRDVVGMARTGAGKTAAFLIPIIEKLKTHSPIMGSRSIILSPTRELALQTYKFAKDLSKGSGLVMSALVGGEGMNNQFEEMATNPDIIITTPGRLVHLLIEMNLQLSAVEIVVFDEADRLFEQGFDEHVSTIMKALPTKKQSLLFSATLPANLLQFARATLVDPLLLRLDLDTKLSPSLSSEFLITTKQAKYGALLHLLRKLPDDEPTIVFAATKYAVEFLSTVLTRAHLDHTFIYGSMDPTARSIAMSQFRSHKKNIMIVTDVAARGLDIPLLNHVINFDYPENSKIFLHRVGRAARAGRSGNAYSLVNVDEVGYVLDLALFLGRKIYLGDGDRTTDIVLSTASGRCLSDECEFVQNLLKHDCELIQQYGSMQNGYKKYLGTRTAPSPESYERAKSYVQQDIPQTKIFQNDNDEDAQGTNDFMKQIRSYRPSETVFEMHRKTGSMPAASEAMTKRRMDADSVVTKHRTEKKMRMSEQIPKPARKTEEVLDQGDIEGFQTVNLDESVMVAAPKQFKDDNNFVQYRASDYETERGYNSLTAANIHSSAVTSLASGKASASGGNATALGQTVWDSRKKKFVKVAGGRDNKKLVEGPGGIKISDSYHSGRHQRWEKQHGVKLPQVGEPELDAQTKSRIAEAVVRPMGRNGRIWHSKQVAPTLDPKSSTYARKMRIIKARERDGNVPAVTVPTKKARDEIKSLEKMEKDERVAEQKRGKTGRHSGSGAGVVGKMMGKEKGSGNKGYRGKPEMLRGKKETEKRMGKKGKKFTPQRSMSRGGGGGARKNKR